MPVIIYDYLNIRFNPNGTAEANITINFKYVSD